MRRLVAALTCVCALTGCTRSGAEPPNAAPVSSTSASSTPSPEPVSLAALMQEKYDGSRLRLGAEVFRSATQRQYGVTYRGDGLTISGRIAIPDGQGPFPAVVLAHGYVDPSDYASGQGMTREREWFADHGYVALHVDYRGYGDSDESPMGLADLGLGYVEDVINAVLALRAWDGPVDDDRIALAGRSLGGGVVLDALVVDPGLVDAAAVWAPVSSDAVDTFERFVARDPARQDLEDAADLLYGSPQDDPEFWAGISARSYFDRVTEPVLINHGTADTTCPIRWSRATTRLLRAAGGVVTLAAYPGEGHSFGALFDRSMARTGRFLDQRLG